MFLGCYWYKGLIDQVTADFLNIYMWVYAFAHLFADDASKRIKKPYDGTTFNFSRWKYIQVDLRQFEERHGIRDISDEIKEFFNKFLEKISLIAPRENFPNLAPMNAERFWGNHDDSPTSLIALPKNLPNFCG